ncbi:hypothetical protein GCM10007938_43070 [Vibrio zhanjiangensis]|uniref:Uncharacterized protein n=1 Tax=Vibrio zhanjiangensis TaxID=1046128 RepID=A0ABQ6F5K4_9VIBR|nr:hypothetical protein [Vibrio zhanjiangensis]GLT20522.1 hypothetical protein GCM10007938_43070 [Vibrio zhanjiangensis]
MSTAKAVAEYLGVSTKTLSNQSKSNGYEFVRDGKGKIIVDESAKAFVKHQSEIIRKMKAAHGRDMSLQIGSSESEKEPETSDEWKAEKEKQAAIKIRLQNEKDLGEMVPYEALFELYNKPLSLVKSSLIDLSNQISKRIPLEPSDIKTIDGLVHDALHELDEKGLDELQSIITPIIQRYSKYYRSSEEDGDSYLGDD